MICSDMKTYPKTIKVTPTQCGNGFVVGEVYEAHYLMNSLYTITLGLAEKIIQYPNGANSPHLWDGRNIEEMGSFELLLDDAS